VPIALAEAVDSGRVKVGDRIVIIAFGAGFTSGAAVIEWTADPARAALAASVLPGDVHIRQAEGWDRTDPTPPRLKEALAWKAAQAEQVELTELAAPAPDIDHGSEVESVVGHAASAVAPIPAASRVSPGFMPPIPGATPEPSEVRR
jgi:hypothetical protein